MSDFAQPRDLNNPAQLVAECEDMSRAMVQQAESSKMGAGSAGHPNPIWLYTRAANVFQAAANLLKKEAARKEVRDIPVVTEEKKPAPEPAKKK